MKQRKASLSCVNPGLGSPQIIFSLNANELVLKRFARECKLSKMYIIYVFCSSGFERLR